MSTAKNEAAPHGQPETAEIILPTAKEALKTVADIESEKAFRESKHGKDGEAEKKELVERLRKPSGLSREEKIQLAARVIQRAINRGVTEVQVYRFPNDLCTDHGRAIIQMESGWENSLTGVPREIFDLWREHLQPRGYKISYQVIEYPGGLPGDIGISLSWR
jgi:hypothetical protein